MVLDRKDIQRLHEYVFMLFTRKGVYKLNNPISALGLDMFIPHINMLQPS